MYIKDVEEKLQEIREAAEEGDYEKAHCAEVDLYTDVLRALSTGTYSQEFAASMAAAVLEAEEIDFERHFA